MRELKIACGNSRQAKQWPNKTISFDELCGRLQVPVLTSESAEEYLKLPKKQRDEIKDKGGFVAGHLLDNSRKQDKVVCRSMLVYDLDHLTKEAFEGLEISNKGCLYTTHSHTADAPRARVLLPLTRDVTPDEFVALARYYASEKKWLDLVDPCSFSTNQLMYWPTCSANGEYVFKVFEGEWLNPDEVLGRYPDWRNCSLLPTTPKESIVIEKAQRQQDPLEKKGIVGIFCRTYSIADVIEEFLPEVYRQTDVAENRYDFIAGEGSAGVVVYDDKFAYSHHATDPAGQKLCNAFDLVRIHKFGTDTDSFKAMSDFAVSLDKVKTQIMAEKHESASEDFAEVEDWTKGLEFDKQGRIVDSFDNVVYIMMHDPKLSGIAFNCQRNGVDIKGRVPWEQVKKGWNDTDLASLKLYLSKYYGIYVPNKTKDAVIGVAATRKFHPIKEYLESLPAWDGVRRVDTLFTDYFGADDTSYTRAVSRKSLVAAVARIYHPGIKFDSVPIIYGPQGIGKSTFYAKLAGEWFSDSLTITDMKDKAAPEKLQGYWILELGELAGMRKTDVETVKSFITRTDDKYRASYGVNVESHPRQCIVVGTTNAENGFLRDITGNRRFWPIRAKDKAKKHPWDMTSEEVLQIWAEVMVLYANGETLYLEGDDIASATVEQDAAMETDEREGIVRQFLEMLLPDNWDSMTIYERRNYVAGSDFAGSKQGTVVRQVVCNMEILCECLGRDYGSVKTADSYTVSAIMKKMSGWEKDSRRNFPIYGQQRGYKRTVRTDNLP